MRALTPIALSLALVFAAQAVQAESNALAQQTPAGGDGVAAGLDMMLRNGSLLRNGDNVWERAREGFELREVNADLVHRFERQYTANPEYLRTILSRSHKYLFHIMNEVERRGMPTEIALLPMVESAFNPTAVSRVGASGLWQFMPTTGRLYGLEQTWWYDGRRDVVEATRAALDYLQNLYGMFGDWTLALAAYNWGEGNLARSIARTRARGETESYENVAMPNETRNYVPKLIAIRNILAEPSKYGIKLDRFPNKPYFATVSTGKHIDMDLAAKLADTPLRELKELNPAYNLPVAAYKSGRQLLVPVDKLSRFEHNLAKWDKPLLNWQVVMPNSGESVQSVASRFGMNPSELISANHLSGPRLQSGHPLLVALRKGREPTGGISPIGDTDTSVLVASAGPNETSALTATAEAAASNSPSPAPLTLVASAVPMAPPVAVKAVLVESRTLEASKAPTPSKIRVETAGKTESVAEASSTAMAVAVTASEPAAPKAIPAVNPNASTHTVASGDTLYNISHRYNLTVAELKTLNNLPDDTVKLGQVLKLKSDNVGGAAATAVAVSAQDDAVVQVASLKPAAQPASPRAVPVEYVVQKGDTLFSIARKFGVSHTDIRDEATLRRHGLVPGQRLWIQGL